METDQGQKEQIWGSQGGKGREWDGWAFWGVWKMQNVISGMDGQWDPTIHHRVTLLYNRT